MNFLKRTFFVLILIFGIFGGGLLYNDYTIIPARTITAYANDGNAGNANDTKDTATKGVAENGSQAKTSVDTVNGFINVINTLIGFLTVLISPLILLASWLLSPDWTSGDIFNLRDPMMKINTTVANLVYVIYAILLIFVAAATMFNSKTWGYRELLPRILLGLILMPFTWWIIQFIVSISSVITFSAVTIPANVMNTLNADKSGSWWEKPTIPKKISVDKINTKTSSDKESSNSICEEKPDECISAKQFLSNSTGVYGHLVVYAYAIFKLDSVKLLSTGKIDITNTSFDVLQKLIVNGIMFVIFGLLILALVAILFVRALHLWLYMIFSPLLTLKLVSGKILGNVGESFSLKELIGLAFVPAIVGLALSFGMIVMAAVQQGSSQAGKIECTVAKLKGEGCVMMNIMGTGKIIRKLEKTAENGQFQSVTEFKIGDGDDAVTWRILGGVLKSDAEAEKAAGGQGSSNILDVSSGVLGTIIVQVIALMFMWLSFMLAKHTSKTVESVIHPFEDIGKRMMGIMKQLPGFIPIPGIGSVSGMGQMLQSVEYGLANNSIQNAQNSPIGQVIKDVLGQNNNPQSVAAIDSYRDQQNTTSLENVRNVISGSPENSQYNLAAQIATIATNNGTKAVTIEQGFTPNEVNIINNNLGKFTSIEDAQTALKKDDTLFKAITNMNKPTQENKAPESVSPDIPIPPMNENETPEAYAKKVAEILKDQYQYNAKDQEKVKQALASKGIVDETVITNILAALENLNKES